jgi:multiple antibiotic resistance protein
MPEASESIALSLGQIFTFLFVMLGPFKLLGPYMHLTAHLDAAVVRQVAFRAFGIAVVAVIAGGLFGRSLMHQWTVSVPAMILAGGLIFLLVGLHLVLQQYEPPQGPAARSADPPVSAFAAAMRITFPIIVTPYGVAALIVLLATSPDMASTVRILGIAMIVMVLNLLAMLNVRRIMAGGTVVALQILGAVLGVLQVALAVQLILRALARLGVLSLRG